MTTPLPAVVLLGAAEYPESPSLDNPAFRGSHEGFRDYCTGALGVPADADAIGPVDPSRADAIRAQIAILDQIR